MPEEIEYFENKSPNRVYVSSPFEEDADEGNMRFVSKVYDFPERHEFVEVKGETVLRVSEGQRIEIKALFYEDSRQIRRLTLQKFTRATGKPHKLCFNFTGEEIYRIYNLFRVVKYMDLDEHEKQRLDDEILDDLLVGVDAKKRFLLDNIDLLTEILGDDVSLSEMLALKYRREQLDTFQRLLNEPDFFERKKSEWSKRRSEDVWQDFFERNPWIFGYGLDYVFTTNLDDKKLEQVVSGADLNQSGKRVDALLRTRGRVSSLCFVEIKIHTTPLLQQVQDPYRGESWRISAELSGSIAQIHKTVQKASMNIGRRLEMIMKDGDPTGEVAYLYQPKSIVLIGSLAEFEANRGINEQKFSSFELFRRNQINPEIVTFDELYERAKFIVQHSEDEATLGGVTGSIQNGKESVVQTEVDSDSSWDDIPF